MVYTKHYMSPLGGIILAADDEGLIWLWFDGQKYFGTNLPKEYEEKETPFLFEAERWLDIYFSKKKARFYAAASHDRLGISPCGLERAFKNSVRQNRHIRRNSAGARR